MNRVILIGRTTKEWDVRETENALIARNSLAIDRRGKDKGSDFVNIVCFNQTAELVNEYVKKGNKIGIVGRLQSGSYDKEGKTVYTLEVVIDEVEFLQSKTEEKEEPKRKSWKK